MIRWPTTVKAIGRNNDLAICTQQAAIEDLAFKQLDEQEDKDLRSLKRKHLEQPTQQPQQQQGRGTGNFRSFSDASPFSNRSYKDRPCRNFNSPKGCGRGDSCRFGHFYAAAPGAAPPGSSGQYALAPAASYATVAHSNPAGTQR